MKQTQAQGRVWKNVGTDATPTVFGSTRESTNVRSKYDAAHSSLIVVNSTSVIINQRHLLSVTMKWQKSHA